MKVKCNHCKTELIIRLQDSGVNSTEDIILPINFVWTCPVCQAEGQELMFVPALLFETTNVRGEHS